MAESVDYDIFLSFSSEDREIIRSIWQELSLNGLRVFWSDETLKQNIGQSFFSIIQDALIRSKHFILFWSYRASKSKWVRVEYETFYSNCFLVENEDRRFIIFPLDNSEIPPLLRNIQLTKSVKEIVKVLGGVDFRALVIENQNLKIRLNKRLEESKNNQETIKSLELKNQNYIDRCELLEKHKKDLQNEIENLRKNLEEDHQATIIEYQSRITKLEEILSNYRGYIAQFEAYTGKKLKEIYKVAGKTLSSKKLELISIVEDIPGIMEVIKEEIDNIIESLDEIGDAIYELKSADPPDFDDEDILEELRIIRALSRISSAHHLENLAFICESILAKMYETKNKMPSLVFEFLNEVKIEMVWIINSIKEKGVENPMNYDMILKKLDYLKKSNYLMS